MSDNKPAEPVCHPDTGNRRRQGDRQRLEQVMEHIVTRSWSKLMAAVGIPAACVVGGWWLYQVSNKSEIVRKDIREVRDLTRSTNQAVETLASDQVRLRTWVKGIQIKQNAHDTSIEVLKSKH